MKTTRQAIVLEKKTTYTHHKKTEKREMNCWCCGESGYKNINMWPTSKGVVITYVSKTLKDKYICDTCWSRWISKIMNGLRMRNDVSKKRCKDKGRSAAIKYFKREIKRLEESIHEEI